MNRLEWLAGRLRFEVNELIHPSPPVNFEFNEPECHIITEPVGTELHQAAHKAIQQQLEEREFWRMRAAVIFT